LEPFKKGIVYGMLLHQAGHGFWIFPFWVLSITMDFA
jgi:hypothetical protein